ncbi:MAG TPA: CBS domain-containing protein, partial [Polyangiaceae bacterium]|nr:CBS domain-containing protein [Polyangiaceae bacterium]
GRRNTQRVDGLRLLVYLRARDMIGLGRSIGKSLLDLRALARERGLVRTLVDLLAPAQPSALAPMRPLAGTVADVMTRNVASCTGGDTLHRAAQLMWDRDCGAIPIVDAEGRAAGLVTDRDLCMAAYTRSRPLGAISVASLLSGQLHTCAPHTTIEDAVQRMRVQRIRRLVVVDGKDQRLLGMLSVADLARSLAARSSTEPRADKLLSELLAALSERRGAAERAAE